MSRAKLPKQLQAKTDYGADFVFDETKPIWKQQAGEKDRCYAAFMRFCSLGPTRTIKQVQKEFKGMIKFPYSYRWAERAAAYDKQEHDESAEQCKGYRERYRKAMEELVATTAEDVLLAKKKGDKKKLLELAPWISIVLGEGKVGKFLTDANAVLFPEQNNPLSKGLKSLTMEFKDTLEE